MLKIVIVEDPQVSAGTCSFVPEQEPNEGAASESSN